MDFYDIELELDSLEELEKLKNQRYLSFLNSEDAYSALESEDINHCKVEDESTEGKDLSNVTVENAFEYIDYSLLNPTISEEKEPETITSDNYLNHFETDVYDDIYNRKLNQIEEERDQVLNDIENEKQSLRSLMDKIAFSSVSASDKEAINIAVSSNDGEEFNTVNLNDDLNVNHSNDNEPEHINMELKFGLNENNAENINRCYIIESNDMGKEFVNQLDNENNAKNEQSHLSQLETEYSGLVNLLERQTNIQTKLKFKLDKLLIKENTLSCLIRKDRDLLLDIQGKIKHLPNEIYCNIKVMIEREKDRLNFLTESGEKFIQLYNSGKFTLLQKQLTQIESEIQNVQNQKETIRVNLISSNSEVKELDSCIKQLREEIEDQENLKILNQQTLRRLKTNILEKQNRSVTKISSLWKGVKQRLKFLKLKSSVIKIQCFFRIIAAKRITEKFRKSRMLKKTINAAIYIQKFFRGYRVRKRIRQTRTIFETSDSIREYDDFNMDELMDGIEEIDLGDLDFHLPDIHDITPQSIISRPIENQQEEIKRSGSRSSCTGSTCSIKSRKTRENINSTALEWGLSSNESVELMYKRQQKFQLLAQNSNRRKLLQDPMARLKMFQRHGLGLTPRKMEINEANPDLLLPPIVKKTRPVFVSSQRDPARYIQLPKIVPFPSEKPILVDQDLPSIDEILRRL